MNTKKDLNYFMNLDYNLILREEKSKYYIFLPELSLLVEGNNLLKTYESLKKEKEKYFKNIIKLKAEDTVKEPLTLTIRKKIFNELTLFFVKALIIFFAFLIVFLGSLPLIIRTTGQLPNRFTEVIVSLSDKLHGMPEDNKEKLRLKLRQMVKDLKPMTDELKILWEDKEDVGKQDYNESFN